jgi:GntR family transcriptional regulator
VAVAGPPATFGIPAAMQTQLPPIVTEPVHQQLAKTCRAEIASGVFRPADRFPSERKLAEKYRVSRSTANKVISNMIAEGMLVLRPGIGTFVAPIRGLHTSLREMESFTDSALSVGKVPETKVICFRKQRGRQLSELVRTALQLELRESAYYFERLRFASGEPVILEYRWIRCDLVPELTPDKLQGSLYHHLENDHQIYLTGERHKIRAKNLSAQEAVKFRLKAGAAVLVVEGTGLTGVALPVWYQILFYRGDRYELENEVHVAGGQGRLAVRKASTLRE